MGWFKIKQGLAVGGSVAIGADCSLYREAANRLATGDALSVGGTVNLQGATRIGGALTAVSSATFSGTPFVIPHGTVAPSLTTNGEIKVYDPTGAGKVSFRIGGTVYTLAFPSASHGTVTITVGTPT
jgi:hypothetical protein